MRSRGFHFGAKFGVNAQHFGGLRGVVEQIPHNGVFHCGAFGDSRGHAVIRREVIFRRRGRRNDELAVFAFDQIGQPKLGSAFQCGINRTQIIAVTGEGEVFPQMLAHPPTTAPPDAPTQMCARRSPTPTVRGVTDHPTGCARPEISLRRPGAGFYQVLRHAQHRCVQLAQVGRLGGPIVHLVVDVRFIVALPRQVEAIAPDALRVRG